MELTFRELLQAEDPDMVDEKWAGGCSGCPSDYGYEPDGSKESLCGVGHGWQDNCRRCWDRESGLEISASYDEDDIEPVAESDDLDEMDEPTCNFCSHYKDTPWCVDCEDKCHMCVHKAVCRFTNEFFGERKICRNFLKA
jgi:hypothetical protein